MSHVFFFPPANSSCLVSIQQQHNWLSGRMNDVWKTLSVLLGSGEVFHLGKKGAPCFWRMKRPWKVGRMEFSYLNGRNWEKIRGAAANKMAASILDTHTPPETYVKLWSLFMCGFLRKHRKVLNVTLSSRDPQRSSRERREGRRPWGYSSRFRDSRETRGPGEVELTQAVDVESRSLRLLGLAAHNLWLPIVLWAVGVFLYPHDAHGLPASDSLLKPYKIALCGRSCS